MIVRRFGSSVSSVEPQFNARAMTEIAFRRTGDFSMKADELDAEYERADERELTATAEGDVQSEVEQAVLASLEKQLGELDSEAGPDTLLLIESEPGRDYPKTRDRTRTVVVGPDNRLHFEYTIDPPLRLAVLRKR